jgi:glycosyltransferase involved in cell wall biosynthesis
MNLPLNFQVQKASKSLKICILYSRNPFPMMRGDQLTVSHLISYLAARGHDVDLITLDTGGDVNSEQVEWLENTCRRVIRIKHNFYDMALGLLKGVFRLLPLQVGLFFNQKQMDIAINLDQKEKYDVIYTYYLRSAEAGSKFSGRNILAMQLSQYLNTLRIRDNTKSFFKKTIYSFETWLLGIYEGRVWRNFKNVAVIGKKDLCSIDALALKYHGEKIPNWFYSAHGTDISKFKPADKNKAVLNRIVFSGSMLYEPNIQAIGWFIYNCWDSVRSEIPEAELYIVGRDPTETIRNYSKIPGIHVTGTVADPWDYINTASVCINPMQSAGGMQNKLIEYMATKKPVVCTDISNEGIGAPDDTVLIANSPQDFSQNVCKVLKEPESFSTMAHQARKYIESYWTWEYHFSKLEKRLYDVSGIDLD